MVAEQEGTAGQSAAAQEADVTMWKLMALMMRLVVTEIPLMVIALVCVMASTLLDNMIPDIQGRIFSDLYATSPTLARIFASVPFSFSAHPELQKFLGHLLTYLYFLLGNMALNTIRSQTFQVDGTLNPKLKP